jgi:hypothetical protein
MYYKLANPLLILSKEKVMLKINKLKFLITIVLLMLPLTSQADINGSWIGWGEWKYEGSGTDCSTIKFDFNETDHSLTRTSGSIDCDVVSMQLPELRLEKSGQDLTLDGVNVGHFDVNNYSWAEVYNENVKIRVELNREVNHIDYHEIWLDSSISNPDHILYEINARVFTGSL